LTYQSRLAVLLKNNRLDTEQDLCYYTLTLKHKEQEMRKVLGTAGVVLGMLAMVGLAGGVTELGPEAGVNEYLSILSTAIVAGCLINLGMFMMKDEL
jgi:hypothetical protein